MIDEHQRQLEQLLQEEFDEHQREIDQLKEQQLLKQQQLQKGCINRRKFYF